MQKRRIYSRRTAINTTQLLQNRSYFDVETMLRNRLQTASPFMRRLEQEALLSGHDGCVNGLEWNSSGRLLASVSDDCHVMVWDAFRHRRLNDLRTSHQGNIFAVKFMPQSGDRRVLTGAADSKVLVHDIERSGGGEVATPVWSCECHQFRVKSVAVSPDSPDMLWTSAEDGTICQFDLRVPHTCHSQDRVLLINLNNHAGPRSEVKCIAINPRRPEMLAVGANDPYARVFDRRKIAVSVLNLPTDFHFLMQNPIRMSTTEDRISERCATYYCPGQFRGETLSTSMLHKAITYVSFSPDGSELLVNMGAEQIYLYDLNGQRRATFMRLPAALPDDEAAADGKSPAAAIPPVAEARKLLGNKYLHEEKFLRAIDEYTAAIRTAPGYATLYLNRAAAYMRRNWYGDQYAALRDCQQALRLDPGYVKAHFRWARALLELNHAREAAECLDELQRRFPAVRRHAGVLALRKDIDSALKEREHSTVRSGDKDLSGKEAMWRRQALDYEERFVGHCNTTTDIKQASFFGNDANYIVAGSDDGNFFIWDRSSNRISNIFKGDNAIVNCVQPHPSVCLLATSGIEDTIRLWSPQAAKEHDDTDADGDVRTGNGHKATERVDGAVQNNQVRMQADPFDVDISRFFVF